MEFTGRDRFLDRFEEKVTQGEVEEAIAELNRMPGIEVREFMVGPDISQRRHLWILAVRSAGSGESERIGRFLDQRLTDRNADYGAFRVQNRIREPEVVIVGEEAIYCWSKEVRGKLGGQSKIPHIDPTPEGEMVRSLAEFARGDSVRHSRTATEAA